MIPCRACLFASSIPLHAQTGFLAPQGSVGCSAQVPESKDQVIKPERVLVLSKSMRVRWRDLGAHMHRPGVTSLDDIMRIDLHYIMRCTVLSFLVLWLACPFGQTSGGMQQRQQQELPCRPLKVGPINTEPSEYLLTYGPNEWNSA
jgi:hypothetical protein